MGDESIMYTRSSDGLKAGPALQRLSDGSTTYGTFYPSALSIAFPFIGGTLTNGQYAKAIASAAQAMPQGENRTYIEDFMKVSLKYALVLFTGKTVTEHIDNGVDRAAINYDTIGTYGAMKTPMNADGSTMWDVFTKPLVDPLGGNDAVRSWMDPIVRQQASEAVDKTRATAKDYEYFEGTGLKVTLNDIHKRVVTNVQESIALELPAFQKYVDERWKTLADADMSRRVPVPVDGRLESCSLSLRKYSLKVKYADGGIGHAKAYLRGDAMLDEGEWEL